VNRKHTPPIPDPIVRLQRQLDQFRSTQPRRTKLPESLWQAAVELARQYGVYSVAHPLQLREFHDAARQRRDLHLVAVPAAEAGEGLPPVLGGAGTFSDAAQFINVGAGQRFVMDSDTHSLSAPN
jgi:hypothetical protein